MCLAYCGTVEGDLNYIVGLAWHLPYLRPISPTSHICCVCLAKESNWYVAHNWKVSVMTKEASAESSLRFQLLRALLPPIGCNTRGVWAICGAAVGNNRQGAPGRPLPNLLPPKPTLTSPKTSLTSGFALCFIKLHINLFQFVPTCYSVSVFLLFSLCCISSYLPEIQENRLNLSKCQIV